MTALGTVRRGLRPLLDGCLAFALAMIPTPAHPQANTTAAVAGRVSSEVGVLPGVTVTAESSRLQQPRVVHSSRNGDYLLPLLPPGEYDLSWSLDGFRPEKRTVRLAVGQPIEFDVRLTPAASDSIEVEAEQKAVGLSGPTVAMSAPFDLLDELPVERTLQGAVSLAPNAHFTGPDDRLSISGAIGVESLYLVDGVVVNDNVEGHPLPLYIEDAVQEITTKTGSLSAEYGRFSGGVVNVITKSGGDRFSGSLRISLDNDAWRETTPSGEEKDDETIPTWEATLGGPILPRRLWFFAAGRLAAPTESRQTAFTEIPYVWENDEERFEGKLTWSPRPRHTVRAAYTGRDQKILNNHVFLDVMDLESLAPKAVSEDLVSLHLASVLSDDFFLEAQVSRRRLTFESLGSPFAGDLIRGTPFQDNSRGLAIFNSSAFCVDCSGPRRRDNEGALLEGSWFASTERFGSHVLDFGVETFSDQRFANNHQSGSGYGIFLSTSIVRGREVFPVMAPFQTAVLHFPILVPTRGNDFRTHSAYLNDRMRVNDRWSLNLGLRYDRNDGEDSLGQQVARDDIWSPRLALAWDPSGDGRWEVRGGFGRYVASLYNIVGDADSSGGRQSLFAYLYLGPAINTDLSAPTSDLVPPREALEIIFDWFFSHSAPLVAASVPGEATEIRDTLRSPHVDEWSGGVSRRFGSHGVLRFDGMYRRFSDFYSERVDTTTGQVTGEFGTFDLRSIENTNAVEREYASISLQGRGRTDRGLEVGGTWTISRSWGNSDGESAGAPAVLNGLTSYPEYRQPRWHHPSGDLAIDRRHQASLWLRVEVPFPERLGSLELGLVESFRSGTPYGAVGQVFVAPYVENPGYLTPPVLADYYFTARDAFRTESSTATDVSLSFSFPWSRGPTAFAQLQVLNLFDESAIVHAGHINRTVLLPESSPDLESFDPFEVEPVRGVHWNLHPDFGSPINRFAYQPPRTLRASVGVRF